MSVTQIRQVAKKYSPLLPVVGYILIVFGLFLPVLFPPAGKILFGDDFIHAYYYSRIFIRESVIHGRLPLWNPYQQNGLPGMEYPLLTFWSPLSFVFVILPIPVAFPLYLALHITIAMSTMYWLMRHWVDRLPAWLSGIAFGLSTYFWYRIPAGHIDVLASAVWIPLIFGLSYRICFTGIRQGKKRLIRLVIITGIAIAVQVFSGNSLLVLLTAESVGFLCLFACIKQRTLMPFLHMTGAAIVGGLLASAELLGNAEFMKQSVFYLNFPYSWASVGTPTIDHLLEILDPVAYALRNPGSVYLVHERAAYIGAVGLVLALVGTIQTIRLRFRRPEYWVFIVISVLGIWIGFAYSMPVDLFHILKNILPWYRGLEVPPRHFYWFVFGASALAGVGAQFFRPKIIRILLVALLLYQLVPIARSQLYLVPTPESREDQDLITYLEKSGGLNRFATTYYFFAPEFPININAPTEYHLYSAQNYQSPTIANQIDLIMAVDKKPADSMPQYFEGVHTYENFSSRFTDALNIKYVLVPVSSDPFAADSSGRFILVKENVVWGWRLYENTHVLPRFFMVPHAEILPDRAAVDSIIRKDRVDPSDTVLFARTDVGGALPQATCRATQLSAVEVSSYSSTDITVRTNNSCAGWLVTSDVFYPGWYAYIDGRETAILEGDLAFRSVFVPKGEHTITFRYIPYMVYAGMAISFVAAVCCGIILRNCRH